MERKSKGIWKASQILAIIFALVDVIRIKAGLIKRKKFRKKEPAKSGSFYMRGRVYILRDIYMSTKYQRGG